MYVSVWDHHGCECITVCVCVCLDGCLRSLENRRRLTVFLATRVTEYDPEGDTEHGRGANFIDVRTGVLVERCESELRESGL